MKKRDWMYLRARGGQAVVRGRSEKGKWEIDALVGETDAGRKEKRGEGWVSSASGSPDKRQEEAYPPKWTSSKLQRGKRKRRKSAQKKRRISSFCA
jgi:hypothetical protein